MISFRNANLNGWKFEGTLTITIGNPMFFAE